MRKAFVIKGCFFALLLAGLLALGSAAMEDMSTVNSLKLEKQGETARFIIEKAGAVDCQDFILKNPERLVIDFIGARHQLQSKVYDGDGKLVEKVRTSQFMNAPEEITRVVFDLKEKSVHKITQEQNRVVVEFYPEAVSSKATPGVMTGSTLTSPVTPTSVSWDVDKTSKPEKKQWPSQAPDELAGKSSGKKWAGKSPQTGNKSWSSPSPEPEASLAASWQKAKQSHLASPSYSEGMEMQASGMGMVKNRKITIDVQNANIKTVLESFAEFSGVNIVSGPEVTGEVTAHIKKLPWRQALNIVLKTHGFGYEEQYGVIRVSTIDNLTKEELNKEAAERKKDELRPLETRIIPLAYADAAEIQKALKRIVSQRGHIEVEPGSNALIVTDIRKNVDEVESMVKSLDKKIKQVEIIAKLVDVDVGATKDMGIRWDFLNLAPANVSVVGDVVIDALPSTKVGEFRVGTVRSWGELRTVIDMLEQSNKANIISNPRIVTADNREASILVGKEIPLIVSDEAGNPITELTSVGIGLRVTPHVNSDGTIMLDIHPEVSELSAQATVQGGVIISISEADTRVVVADGETAVIGGLISQVESTLERGLPVLKDIPFVGNLFKYKNTTKSKRELIIFITPRVVTNLSAHSS